MNDQLLTEYQACQSDINANSSSYWTMAGIFIGISAGIFGGILYSLLSNYDKFVEVFKSPTSSPSILIPIGITVLGGVMISILCNLKGWLRRIQYLNVLNYKRMREIEVGLGIYKSWRVHSIDSFKREKISTKECTERDINSFVDRFLEKELSKEQLEHANRPDLKNYLINHIGMERQNKKYRFPSSERYYLCIWRALLTLWILMIVGTWGGIWIPFLNNFLMNR